MSRSKKDACGGHKSSPITSGWGWGDGSVSQEFRKFAKRTLKRKHRAYNRAKISQMLIPERCHDDDLFIMIGGQPESPEDWVKYADDERYAPWMDDDYDERDYWEKDYHEEALERVRDEIEGRREREDRRMFEDATWDWD